jgi:pentatricopeptide repeat protein
VRGADPGAADAEQPAAQAQAAADPIALIKEGKALMGGGDLDGAENKLLQAYALGAEQNHTQALQFSSMMLAQLYESRANTAKAIEFYEKSAAAFAGQAKYLSMIYTKLGDLSLSTARRQNAAKFYTLALENFAALGDTSKTAVIQNSLALAYMQSGEYVKAEEIYLPLLESVRASGDAAGAVRVLRSLGDMAATRSAFGKALDYYNQALAAARDAGMASDEIMILNGMALVHQSRADLGSAREVLDQALPLAEKGDDKLALAATYHQQGIMALHKGDAGRAIDLYQKSADLKRELGDPTLSNTLAEIGRAHYFSGNYREARRFYNEALKAGATADTSITIGNNLAMVYKMQGQLDYALENFEQSLDIARRNNLPYHISFLLNNIGIVLRDKGDLDAAIEKHREALAIDEQVGDRLGALVDRNNIAVALRLKGEFGQALELLEPAVQEARDIGSYDDFLRTLINLGETYLLNSNFEGAVERFAEAADTAEKTNNPERRWNALFGMGRAYEEQGDAGKAVATYKAAVDVIETLRAGIGGGDDDKNFFLVDKVKVYVRLIELLYKQGQPEEALKYLERMKARSLLDIIQKGKVDVNKGMSPEETKQESTHKINLAEAARAYAQALADKGLDSPEARAAKQELDAAKLAQQQFNDSLYKTHPELAFARGESEPVSPADVQKVLNADEVIIAYLLTDETIYAWTITKDEIKMIDLEQAPKKVEFMVDKKLRSALEEGVWGTSQQKASQQLYSAILEPLQGVLEGKAVLGILPDGRLYEMPFIVLLDSEGKYLIDKLAVYYTPSLSVLVEMRRAVDKLKNEDKVLAFANPTFTRKDLAALPGTETEVKEIADIFGDRAAVHFHEDAIEDHIKRYGSGFRIVHLASHGLLNNNNPMFSSIAMSQIADQADDGYLQAREIPNIDLDAELVIMSACESGRGRLQPGEGIMGLTRSFFSAGVPGIAASLWEVNDAATSFLMRKFYSTYPQMRSVDALRQAQLATREEFGDNPNLWAPFFLIGFGVPQPQG